jgi:primary-amine oxidase
MASSNFRGERIIYELSPQEAMAQYSGIDPHQASTVWLDRAFGMGSNVRELILGYDCPADAILLNATVHESGSSTRRNAICIFESDKHIPLSRHTERGKNVMGAVRGHELVVRTISTVGNYDYIVSRHRSVEVNDFSLARRVWDYVDDGPV